MDSIRRIRISESGQYHPSFCLQLLWGVTVSILRDGEIACDIKLGFDEEYAEKAQYLDIDPEVMITPGV